MANGVLIAAMDFSNVAADEFDDWYDTEHVPERQRVPGFLTLQRWIGAENPKQSVATYDLDNLAVLQSPGYRAIGGENLSPWSKRIGARVTGQWRFGGTQIYPGSAVTGERGVAACLLLVRWRNAEPDWKDLVVKGLKANFEGRRGVLQTRAFQAENKSGVEFLGLVEATLPINRADLDLEAFGHCAKGIDCINAYAPYWRRGES